MLNPGWRESHRNGFPVYRAAGRNCPTVVFKKRLEAEADAENGSGAQGGVDKLHHAAGRPWMAGAGGKHNYVGPRPQYFIDRNGVTKYCGIEPS